MVGFFSVIRKIGRVGPLWALVLAVCLPASAQSQADEQCLSCHNSATLQMPLQNGEELSLQVPGDKFGKSAHGAFGCSACHGEIDPAKHPGSTRGIASSRTYSVERAKVCAGCHTDQATQWNHGVHAALLREENPLAPVCTTCHTAHAVMKRTAQNVDVLPCKTCHGDIFTAFSTSVHSSVRIATTRQAISCFTCHGAHEIKVPTAGAGMKGTCLSCHAEALAKHQKWLPNTPLHFDVVSCPACHSPKANRRVDLVLFNSTTKEDAKRPVGVPEFDRLQDAWGNSTGLDPKTLRKLMQALNHPGASSRTMLRGRLEVSTGEEAHQLMAASHAVRDCKTCHKAGAAAFQSVTISAAGVAGIPVHYDIDKNVLRSAFSIPSISGFYAIGGTRIGILDVLLILAVVVGFGVPALHIAIRWLSHRLRNHQPGNRHEGQM